MFLWGGFDARGVILINYAWNLALNVSNEQLPLNKQLPTAKNLPNGMASEPWHNGLIYFASLGCHAILFAHICATLRFKMKVIQVSEFTLETGDF